MPQKHNLWGKMSLSRSFDFREIYIVLYYPFPSSFRRLIYTLISRSGRHYDHKTLTLTFSFYYTAVNQQNKTLIVLRSVTLIKNEHLAGITSRPNVNKRIKGRNNINSCTSHTHLLHLSLWTLVPSSIFFW